MTRQIVLDTETTGLDPSQGDRIIEIGAVEIINGQITGVQYHTYLNPDGRETSVQAYRVNGLDYAMLSDQPRFSDILPHFLRFIDGATIIMHNASFDESFLDNELKICGHYDELINFVWDIICTKKLSGGLSLDDLCLKYKIDTSHRKVHGALIDAELTAKCYLSMEGKKLSRNSVICVLEEFIGKHAEKEESTLLREIKTKLESLE